MNYMIFFVDCLDMQEFKTLSGCDFMADFPTQGNACLDTSLTNGSNQYDQGCSMSTLIKTDHEGFALPAGLKLKPVRHKVLVRDGREHRKHSRFQTSI